jgi:hypothetical protein
LSLLVLLLLALYVSHDFWLPSRYHIPSANETSGPPVSSEIGEQSKSCRDVPGADKVMVLLKTGSSEIYEKLPTHFMTTFKCIPHFQIYSDLAQDFGDHPVFDAIESVSREYRDRHADFEWHRKLAQYLREGQDLGTLQGAGSWNLVCQTNEV